MHLPKNLYSVGAVALGAFLLFGVLLVPALHSVFEISGEITMLRIGQIALLVALPTLVIQTYRMVKEYTAKHPVS